jgi:integrase
MDAIKSIWGHKMKVADFFDDTYKPRRLRGRSQNTVRLYRSSIKNLERTLGRPALLEDLTDDNVAQLMQDIIDRGGSPHTANKERSQLLAIWRFAAQTKVVDRWPTVTPEQCPERVPMAWMPDDVRSLLAAAAAAKGRIGRAPAAVWWTALISVCLDTGERIGAVSQAEWTWLERDWILVPAEARKGRKRDRRYRLAPETVARLKELRKHSQGSQVMFEWPYGRSYIWAKYGKLLQAAGLPHGPKDKFHRLRKTLGSVAYAAGLDAQDLLDHQNKRTTQRYLDPRFTRDVQPSQILADWLRQKPTEGERRTGT